MNKIEYALVDSGDLSKEDWAVEIRSGEFIGDIFKFLVVEPIEENDTLTLHFEYAVIESSDRYEDEQLIRFNQTLGNILENILMDHVTKEENDKNRNDHISESDPQSRLHEEDFSISEE